MDVHAWTVTRALQILLDYVGSNECRIRVQILKSLSKWDCVALSFGDFLHRWRKVSPTRILTSFKSRILNSVY